MSSCRSCRAPIVWAETEARGDKPARKIPLDADPASPTRALPAADGNLVIIGQAGSGSPIVRYVAKGAGRFVTHFASCPNAKEHRK